eukprot:CAMPEP_0194265906 /NCGR_PEP_ID=MMETSP0169-20130528/990_1 /TAXON_ID=218684 /ORGANISM="Corethron pennatum, Strain L29A3" /LENGTH=371 /DNA_ID=CAMNT_0039006475 /DNA_START=25 /DNA_END=1140 /DNA_ORIENTATION=+
MGKNNSKKRNIKKSEKKELKEPTVASEQKTEDTTATDDVEITEEKPKQLAQEKITPVDEEEGACEEVDVDNEKMDDKDDDEESDEEDEEAAPAVPTTISDGRYRNRVRLLTLCSRGASSRQRHLLSDLRALLPHSRAEHKLDVGRRGSDSLSSALREVADVRGCDSVLYIEGRRRGKDGYLHLGVVPHGPSVRFALLNAHTMDELRMTGNCLKGSRPVLTFCSSFGGGAAGPPAQPFLGLLRSMFVRAFGTPRGHPKSKPFVDRTMSFSYADGKIWVRNYQIVRDAAADSNSLVEIGPRFVLDPIRIFSGVFAGQTLYRNPKYVSQNVQRRAQQGNTKVDRFVRRRAAKEGRKARMDAIEAPEDLLGDVFH